jgi:hypothetical protein
MRAALRVVEPKIATATGSLADEARRRLRVAADQLERAIALWREAIEHRAEGLRWKHKRKASHRHVRRSRRHWQRAVRILQAA